MIIPCAASYISFWGWLIQARQSLKDEVFHLALVVVWKIWEGRNNEVHASLYSPPADVVQWSRDYLQLFLQVQVQPVDLKLSPSHQLGAPHLLG